MVAIYKITNPSGHIYIGQSRNLEKRIKQYSWRAVPNQVHLYHSIKKYGWGEHTLTIEEELTETVSQETLNLKEQYYLDLYRNSGFSMMNIREAGSNGRHSQETKNKIGLANMGKRRKLKLSENTIGKIRRRMQGNKYRVGIATSAKQKEIASHIARNRVYTEEYRKNLREAKTGEKNPNFGKIAHNIKPVSQFSLDGTFLKDWISLEAASTTLGIPKSCICECAKGRYKTSGGFVWKSKDN